MDSMTPSENRLYFVIRTDLSEGRRCAQAIHAQDQWCSLYGPHLGTVIVYEVPDESCLMTVLEGLKGTSRTVLWREPDLGNQATALATDHGRLDLPLLGTSRPKKTRREPRLLVLTG